MVRTGWCDGCRERIKDHHVVVYGDEGQYHLGCEFFEVFEEVDDAN